MKCLIDVGACKGQFTQSWLQKNPDSYAECIEPLQDNVTLLLEKFKNQNVSVKKFAIWTSECTKDFMLGTTRENGSLTFYNEAQAIHGDLGAESVECKTLSGLVSQAKNSGDYSEVVLKLDIEGIEFRCLNEMLDNDVFPDVLYFEDSCRKCFDPDEWTSRMTFFDRVIDLGYESRVHVEVKASNEVDYLDNYVTIEEHAPFMSHKTGEAVITPLVKNLANVCEQILLPHESITKTGHRPVAVAFLFDWMLTSTAIVRLDNNDEVSFRSEDPFNSSKDADITHAQIDSIILDLTQPRLAVKVETRPFDEFFKNIKEEVCKKFNKDL